MTSTKEFVDDLNFCVSDESKSAQRLMKTATNKIEQLQADLEAIMQQRDSYRHQASALNLLNEQLEDRCVELEREREEVARKAFVSGANWQAGGLAFNQPVINREADQYIEREYGVDPKQ